VISKAPQAAPRLLFFPLARPTRGGAIYLASFLLLIFLFRIFLRSLRTAGD
jgi:hypothetical protein